MGLFGPPDIAKLEAKRDVNGLIKALGYQKDWSVRRAAAEALGKIGDAGAVEPLVEALKDGDKNVRAAAVKALGEIGDPRAIEPLVAVWRASVGALPEAATVALGKIGDPRAVEPLVAALPHPAAKAALGTIGAPAVPGLVAALRDGNPRVRRAAAEVLADVGTPDNTDLRVRHAIAMEDWDKVVAMGEPAIALLELALADKDLGDEVRAAAARSLGKIGDPHAAGPLVAALRDDRQPVRAASAAALTKLGVPSDPVAQLWHAVALERWDEARAMGVTGQRVLASALGARDPASRRVAAEALGEIGDAHAIKWLVPALEDSDWNVRAAAAEALGKIGDPSAVEPLMAALRLGQNSSLQEAAAGALGRIADPRAVQPLTAALEAALEAERKRMGLGLDLLQAALKGWLWNSALRQALVDALGEIGDPGAVRALQAAMMTDEDGDVCQAAARALGKIGTEKAVWPLVEALTHRESNVRRTAVEALVKIGQPAVGQLTNSVRCRGEREQAAVKVLIQIGQPAVEELGNQLLDRNTLSAFSVEPIPEILRRIGGARAAAFLVKASAIAPHLDTRKGAWASLVAMGKPAVEPLEAALTDENRDVREMAAKALGKIGDPGTVGPLAAALRDGWRPVRRASADALTKLGVPADPVARVWYAVELERWDEAKAMGTAAVEVLVSALGERDRGLRWAAANALGEIRDPAAVGPLVEALTDVEKRIRKEAARSLGEIGDPGATEGLTTALTDESIEVCSAAAEALGRIGAQNSSRSVEVLVRALTNREAKLRRSAAFVLGEMRVHSAIDPLVAAMTDKDIEVRATAAKALGSFSDPRAVNALVAAIGDAPITREASLALHDIGTPAVEPLLVALRNADKQRLPAVAGVLLMLYNNRLIGQEERRLILSEAPRMRHLAHGDFEDRHQDSRDNHVDCALTPHVDEGGEHTDVRGMHTDYGLKLPPEW
jgi:HEAT repeat protein